MGVRVPLSAPLNSTTYALFPPSPGNPILLLCAYRVRILRFASHVLTQLARCVLQIPLVHDVVPIEDPNASCGLRSAQPHTQGHQIELLNPA